MKSVKNILKVALVLTVLVASAANAAPKPGWGTSSVTTTSASSAGQ
jgi:hypothetical protein